MSTDNLTVPGFSPLKPGALVRGRDLGARNWKGGRLFFLSWVGAFREFPDHHRYSERDLGEIEAVARELGADGLICTEKDSFNLPARQTSLPLWVCAISLVVERENDFWRTMMRAIDSRRTARGK